MLVYVRVINFRIIIIIFLFVKSTFYIVDFYTLLSTVHVRTRFFLQIPTFYFVTFLANMSLLK